MENLNTATDLIFIALDKGFTLTNKKLESDKYEVRFSNSKKQVLWFKSRKKWKMPSNHYMKAINCGEFVDGFTLLNRTGYTAIEQKRGN